MLFVFFGLGNSPEDAKLAARMAANTMVSPQTQTFTKGLRLSSLPMQDEMLRTGFSSQYLQEHAGTEADATLF